MPSSSPMTLRPSSRCGRLDPGRRHLELDPVGQQALPDHARDGADAVARRRPAAASSASSTPRHHSGQRAWSWIASQTGSRGDSSSQVVRKAYSAIGAPARSVVVRRLPVADVRPRRLDDLREADHGDDVVFERSAGCRSARGTCARPRGGGTRGCRARCRARERSSSRLTSTSSITAVKIFSRGLWRKPTVIQTTWPRSYLSLLSPSRIVAVLRPRFSWSTKTAE